MAATVDMDKNNEPARVALYIRTVRTGLGAEKVVVNLAKGLVERGWAVDLLLEEPGGDVLNNLPAGVRVITLDEPGFDRIRGAVTRMVKGIAVLLELVAGGRVRSGLLPALFRLIWSRRPPLYALSRYVRHVRPRSVTAFLNHPALVLLLARPRSGPRIMVSVRNHISTSSARAQSGWNRDVPLLMAALYPRADRVIAVSDGVRDDVQAITGLAPDRLTTIYNPYFLQEIVARAAEPSGHPWLDDAAGPPVLVAAGKLRPQKDFSCLFKAFATVRHSRAVRLIVLGEGQDRNALTALAQDLGVADDIDMPGHVDNPYAYFGRAAAFVLSSAWEGFPNVLVEAMACGAPVVSTDCPSGPSEILDNGRFGPLVPVGDAAALARAIESVLDAPPDGHEVQARTREWDADVILAQYEKQLAMPVAS